MTFDFVKNTYVRLPSIFKSFSTRNVPSFLLNLIPKLENCRLHRRIKSVNQEKDMLYYDYMPKIFICHYFKVFNHGHLH